MVPIRELQEGLFSEGGPLSPRGDSAFFLRQLRALFAGSGRGPDPTDAGPLPFSRENPGSVKVEGDPHPANFVNQNRETALQMKR